MWQSNSYSDLSGSSYWDALAADLSHLMVASDPAVTSLANAAAFLYHSIERINWAGFYLYDGSKLILGPFGGKPACTMIELHRGVCGTAAARRETIVVEDVETFPGHIACDAASRSEIVIPLLSGDILLGVLDIDSPEVGRFQEADRIGFEAIARMITQAVQGHAPLV